MSSTLEYNRSLMGESLQAKLNRLDDLRPADKKARSAVLQANRGIKFRAGNKRSHFVVENGTVELGSYAPGYFKLLNLNGQKLADIYFAWIVKGSTNG